MEEHYFHREIIQKLWQVYGRLGLSARVLFASPDIACLGAPKDIRDQRRGAIIILGMLGIARPDEVLSPQKEMMLKVGLGKQGKVHLFPPNHWKGS